MNEDFTITYDIAGKLDDWVHTLAQPVLPPSRVPGPNENFRWELRERSPYALLVAKAVRMVSGIRAALLLADEGFVAESASMLRMVSDFSTEIIAISDGLKRGELTTDQQKFVDQFYETPPETPDEYAAQERRRYVSREALLRSHVRMANDASVDGEEIRKLKRFLNKGYDDYVHGAYFTATELYHGDKGRFLTGGVDSEGRLETARMAVTGKLHEVVTSLEIIAQVANMDALSTQIREARHQLDNAANQRRSR